MRRTCLLRPVLAAVCLAVAAVAAPLQELAVHYAVKAEAPPVIDGELDEACWRAAPAFTRYRPGGGEGQQETRIQLLWDQAGLYVGIGNREARLDRLKITIRNRDGERVWGDDSAELYLDPTATGFSLFNFTINAIATISDYRQMDPGFTDWSWSAPSARAAAGRTADAWVLEFFVAWKDLGTSPGSGDIWMFFHRRLAYTSPNAALTQSSTSGGSYFNRSFGYLCFVDGKLPAPAELGARLSRLARPPWVLRCDDDGQWLYAGGSGQPVAVQAPDVILSQLRAQAQGALESVAGRTAPGTGTAAGDRLGALREQFAVADKLSEPARRMAEYKAIADAASALRDDRELEAFITATATETIR